VICLLYFTLQPLLLRLPSYQLQCHRHCQYQIVSALQCYCE